MAGLNYIKGGNDPVALADEEYPDWLWTCLDTNRDLSEGSSMEVGDEYCKLSLPAEFHERHHERYMLNSSARNAS